MVKIHKWSPEHVNNLIARVETILSDSDGGITLTHRNGIKEDLTVGEMNNCVYVYNDEPDLIRAFEVEGGRAARDINVEAAAKWLYMRSFENEITR